jgi:hypothetical protein
MRGREFSSFEAFRQSFWKEVANDPVLSRGFDVDQLKAMNTGKAPRAPLEQQLGGQRGYQLHHMKPIQHGGTVYDLDNIAIVTPRYHKEALDSSYHQGSKK